MPDPKLDRLRRKIRRARREEKRHTKRANIFKRKAAHVRLLITKTVHRRRDLTKVAILDGTPVTREQKIALLWARTKGWAGVMSSGDRRSKIAALLHRLGKSTQAELYALFKAGKGAPANPPTQGSHMRLGDGVLGMAGEPIPAYEQGLDTSDATNLRAILSSGGFKVQRTYSGEEWHTNFVAPIKPVLVRLGLV